MGRSALGAHRARDPPRTVLLRQLAARQIARKGVQFLSRVRLEDVKAHGFFLMQRFACRSLCAFWQPMSITICLANPLLSPTLATARGREWPGRPAASWPFTAPEPRHASGNRGCEPSEVAVPGTNARIRPFICRRRIYSGDLAAARLGIDPGSILAVRRLRRSQRSRA